MRLKLYRSNSILIFCFIKKNLHCDRMCILEGIRDKVLSVRKLEVFFYFYFWACELKERKERERIEDKEEAARW